MKLQHYSSLRPLQSSPKSFSNISYLGVACISLVEVEDIALAHLLTHQPFQSLNSLTLRPEV